MPQGWSCQYLCQIISNALRRQAAEAGKIFCGWEHLFASRRLILRRQHPGVRPGRQKNLDNRIGAYEKPAVSSSKEDAVRAVFPVSTVRARRQSFNIQPQTFNSPATHCATRGLSAPAERGKSKRDLNSPNKLRHAQPTRKFVRKQPDLRSERTSPACDGRVTAVSACMGPSRRRRRGPPSQTQPGGQWALRAANDAPGPVCFSLAKARARSLQ